MSKPVTAWSFSRFQDYDTCPQKYKFKHVDKIVEPENDAMRNGDAVHTVLAAYVRGDLPPNDPIPGWTYFEGLYRQLRELEPKLVEQEWGFTDRWKACPWFGEDTWFRAKLDFATVYPDNTADVVDFKTGKPRPDAEQKQSELYAVAVFKRYPQVLVVTVRFWYVDLSQAGKESIYTYCRDQAAEIVERWTKRAKRMLSDTIMAPKPGSACAWCYFAKSKKGPCRYG